jgi:predicted nucleic acid-binding Zn ribbon protein
LSNNDHIPPGMKKRGVPLGEALEQYFERHGMKRRVQQASVIPEWPRLVGAKIAEVTTPREVLRDGTLIVGVQSAAWMQELQMMSPEIIKQLAQRGKKIKRILWRAE